MNDLKNYNFVAMSDTIMCVICVSIWTKVNIWSNSLSNSTISASSVERQEGNTKVMI